MSAIQDLLKELKEWIRRYNHILKKCPTTWVVEEKEVLVNEISEILTRYERLAAEERAQAAPKKNRDLLDYGRCKVRPGPPSTPRPNIVPPSQKPNPAPAPKDEQAQKERFDTLLAELNIFYKSSCSEPKSKELALSMCVCLKNIIFRHTSA